MNEMVIKYLRTSVAVYESLEVTASSSLSLLSSRPLVLIMSDFHLVVFQPKKVNESILQDTEVAPLIWNTTAYTIQVLGKGSI